MSSPKINLQITVDLTCDQIEQIIRDYILKSLDRSVESIQFETKTEWHGYSTNEYKVEKFSGAKVKLIS